MFKKVLIFLTVLITVATPLYSVQAAVKKVVRISPTNYSEGWLELLSPGSDSQGITPSVQGWAYDSGKPVYVTVTLHQIDGNQIYTASGQVSGFRPDVAAHLTNKFKKATNKPVSFKIDFSNLTAMGTFRLVTATFNGKPFNVTGNVAIPITVHTDHQLKLVAPRSNDQWTLNTRRPIAWSDRNPLNQKIQTYSLFLSRSDNNTSQRGVIRSEVSGENVFIWNVGLLEDGTFVRPDSGYYIQIVKQYVTGENTFHEIGPFTIFPQEQQPPANSQVDSRENSIRLSDIRQIASALELYYNDNNRYPMAIEFSYNTSSVSELRYLAPRYIAEIPAPKSSIGGSCSLADNMYVYTQVLRDYYTLTFCLSQDTSGYPAGIRILTPNGIQ